VTEATIHIPNDRPGSSLSKVAIQCVLTLIAAIATTLIIALTSGIFAELLVHFLGSSLTVYGIQLILSVYTLVTALALAPLFLHGVFTSITTKAGNKEWLKKYKKSLKKLYPRLTILTVTACIGGLVISSVFDLLARNMALVILERVLLLIVGAVAIYFMYRGYSNKNGYKDGDSCHPERKRRILPARTAKQDFSLTLTASTRPDTSFSHKALRTTIALVLIATSFPAAWLFSQGSWRLAYADEIELSNTAKSLHQPGIPNQYHADSDHDNRDYDSAFLKEPTLAPTPDKPDGALFEVDHDRYSTTWQNSDGTYTTRIQSEPQTYTTEDGSERDIDNTLVPSTDKSGYTNAENSFSVNLPTSGTGVTLEKDGFSLLVEPLFGTLNNAVVKENAILYNNVAKGIDVQYTVYGSEVKEDIILNHPTNLTSFDYNLIAPGITFIQQGNTVLGYRTGEESSKNATPVFTINAPIMKDAAVNTSISISITLEVTDATTTLRIIPDAKWLAAPERIWPVIIDPSHKLEGSNLSQGTIQVFAGYSSDPDMEHNIPYLIVGLEDGSLVAVDGIVYGQSWSFIKINDIGPYIEDLPDRAILSATLNAYKYGTVQFRPGQGLSINACMIMDDWKGDGRHTWNNRPYGADLTILDTQLTPAYAGWMEFDITDAFKAWKNDPSTNRGIMLTPQSEVQDAVAFSGTGNAHGNEALYLDLSWTVPNPIDEDLPLDAPNINLRPLTFKHPLGYQNFVGVFADGLVRPALELEYFLIEIDGALFWLIDSDIYAKTEYELEYPNSDVFVGIVPFTLGYIEMYESNWQTVLYLDDMFDFDTLYIMAVQGTRVYDIWANPDDIFEQTPMGFSDTFLIYMFKQQDTLPYVAAYYGVTRDQLVKDNWVGDDLVFPGNTIFVRNPSTTVPYSRPDNLTLDHMRSLIYANMGRSQVSEFDIEPVNMNTGNFYLEHIDATSYEYGASFNLIRSYNALAPQSAGPFGRGWSTPYQQTLVGAINGDITYITDDGRHLVFTKTDSGWISPSGYNLTLTKHNSAEPEDVTYTITKSDGSFLTFSCYGVLSSITDSYGLSTTITYDDNFHMTSIITSTGRVYSITTDGLGHIATITLPNGGVVSYTYDASGYLTSVTDADGNTIRYEYDARGQMSAWYDGNDNRVIFNTYDDRGRVVEQVDALGNISTLEYIDGATILTDVAGYQTIYRYNDLLQTTSIEREGVTTFKTFNEAGQLITAIDGLGRETVYSYDTQGNLTTILRQDGSFQEIIYDANARPLIVRDYDGSVVQNTYDSNGNLINRINADGTSLIYTYDSYGRMTSLTNELGATTTFSWSDTTLTITDPEGGSTTTYYDMMGRPFNVVDPCGTEYKTIYSLAGRVSATWITGGITASYAYDGAGNCIAITDARGNTSRYTYDAAGNLIQARGPEGSALNYTYDALANKTSETDALGNTTYHYYDAHGNLIKTTDADGNSESFTYDAASRLTSSTNKAGHITTYSYEGVIVRPTIISAPSGVNTYIYDSKGRTLKAHYFDGKKRIYTYDLRGRVLSVSDEAGLTVSYTYDAAGRVVKKSDSAGRTEHFSYDLAGRLISTTNAIGQVTTYTYDAVGRPTSITLPGNLVNQLEYDARGNIIKQIRPDGTELSFTYDSAGAITSITDATGAVTQFHYTALGSTAAVINAEGATSTYSYDVNQRLTAITGPLSETVSYTYDSLSRPIAYSDPLGNTYELSWDSSGQVTVIASPDGSATTTEYDSAGRVTKITDSLGLITEYVYNEKGQLICQFDNAGYDATFAYDISGRVISQTDALGRIASFSYDAWGRLVSTTDFNSDTTAYTYDLIGRITHVSKSTGEEYYLSYDAAGNLVEITDHLGRTTTYTYDLLGKVLTKTDALGQVWHYSYDPQGRPLSEINPEGIESHLVYDKVGRPISFIDGRGNAADLIWDLSSNLIATKTADGAVREYSYDAAGNLLKEKDPLGYVSRYEYDELNRLIKHIGPRGGETTFSYDSHGNLTSVTDAEGNTTTHSYLLNNLRSSTILPNGLEISYTYDLAGRLISASDATGLSITFEYDARGNISKQTEYNGAISTFTYDDAHRMTSATDALGGKTTYSYDSAGNLISSQLSNGSTYAYSYDVLDRMTTGSHSSTLPISFVYDSRGNILQTTQGDKIVSYLYDEANNLTRITDALGNSAKYSYNEVNLLTSYENKTGSITSFTYNQTRQLTSQTDAAGNTRSYSYDADGNLSVYTDTLGNTTSLTYDLIGNLTRAEDPIGRISLYTYDSMGNVTSVTHGKSPTYELYASAAADPTRKAMLILDFTTTYEYDLHSNLTKITSPTGEIESFTYDTASRMTSSTTTGKKTTTYDYDLLGRLISKHYDTTSASVTYAYDSSGNRLSMNDETGKSSYAYNDAGQLISYTQSDGRTLRYSYDAYGRLAKVIYPDNRSVTYTYDLADNLISVTDSAKGVTTYTYDAEGRVLSCLRPDSTASYYSYDELSRLTSLVNKRGDTLLSSFGYTYDSEGRIASEVMYQRGTATEPAISLERNYTYDAAGQLTGYRELEGGKTSTTLYYYDLRGNRIAETTTEGSSFSVVSEYDTTGRLIKQTDERSGEVSTFSYDADGNLSAKQSTAGGATTKTTYTYDAENRLTAVREGGALLMAASYDGDGNRTFQVHRTVVPSEGYGSKLNADTTDITQKMGLLDGLSTIITYFTLTDPKPPGSHIIPDHVYDIEFSDSAFLYGFGLALSTFACMADMAFAPRVQRDFSSAFVELLGVYSSVLRSDQSASFDDDDIAALETAGLSNSDIYDITNPRDIPATGSNQTVTTGSGGATSTGSTDTPPGSSDTSPTTPGSIIIPTGINQTYRYDYELTYYVNDITYQHTQVAAEYGKRGELKNSYTYGNDRLYAINTTGRLDSYLHDGRGSVAQISSGASVIQSLFYDPYGKVVSGADSHTLTFAHNAEEYNPVVDLTYLRARYYTPSTASFITKDTHLGHTLSINSQNRYLYAQADPINNFDPSGHAISNNSYERQMESMGGINEIYNFYVGQTLSNAHGAANAAFYSQLNDANETDYTDIDAINSIAYISQATANAYISYGAYMAQNAGSSWGCSAGTLTGAAINSFAANVNASKDSVNSQISIVQANKYQEYEEYQAYLAYLAYQAYLANLAEILELADQKMQAYKDLLAYYDELQRALMMQHLFENAGNLIKMEFASALRNNFGSATFTSPFYDSLYQEYLDILVKEAEEQRDYYADYLERYLFNLLLTECLTANPPDVIKHGILDALGLLPGVGIVFDAGNALWYLVEGDYENAALSGLSAVPVVGLFATGAKVVKGVKTAGKAADAAATAAKATTKMTTKEATEAARKLGFEKTNYTSHGQPVFKDGNRYITPDIDSHSGGVWKMANSVEDLASKETRLGTFDANLGRIGD